MMMLKSLTVGPALVWNPLDKESQLFFALLKMLLFFVFVEF